MISAILRGGLCNQLFIMAATISHSLRTGIDYCLPMEVENPHYISEPDLAIQKPYIFSGVNYCDRKLTFENQYNEPHFHYAEIPEHESLLLNGYFQSFKYVEPHRAEILKAFGFDDLATNDDWVSVHIRRSDYLKYPTMHPVVTIDYLKEAISIFTKKGDYAFQIFSDDPQWAKDNLTADIFHGHEYDFEETRNEVLDLKYMAMAEHNITANSSYSLWAAYINPNPNKIIVSPRAWFGPDLNHDTSDLYLTNSIIL